jgi:thiosulfate reductase cytochrome b subunit
MVFPPSTELGLARGWHFLMAWVLVITAVFPQLFDLFGGRQSARTVHFLVTVMLVLFVLMHVFQIVVAGFINEMRSMVSGRFAVPPEAHQ